MRGKIEVDYKQLRPSVADIAFDIAEYAHPQTVEGCWAKLESWRERDRITAATYDEIKAAVTFSLRHVTRVVAGRAITLEPGQRYLASRPMLGRGRKEFPVRIQMIVSERFAGEPRGLLAEDVEVIEGLSYEEADKFLMAFNKGLISFEGRIW